MPRKPRSASGAQFHHVYSRGVAKQPIFHTVGDVLAFLAGLAEALAVAGATCLAWAVMKNHYHFVLACSVEAMGVVMHRTLGPYASRYNALHERTGHLFGGRYGSVPIHDETHLKSEVRYVIRNPYEAGVVGSVEELERYPWTGYPTLLGAEGPVPMAIDAVLDLFGQSVEAARQELRKWIATDLGRPGETGLETAIRVVAAKICEAHGLQLEDLRGRATARARSVRAVVVNELRERLRATDALIGRVLGLSAATLSRIARDRAA